MKKITVDVTTRLVIHLSDDLDVNEVLENMDYSFTAAYSDDAYIFETEITDWEIH